MKRDRAAPPPLTVEDAARIKGMLLRGDVQHDIAQYHSRNSGRITEIKRGRKFKDVPPMPKELLPPPGPYTVVTRLSHERGELAERVVRDIREQLTKIVAKINFDLDVFMGEERGDGRGH